MDSNQVRYKALFSCWGGGCLYLFILIIKCLKVIKYLTVESAIDSLWLFFWGMN